MSKTGLAAIVTMLGIVCHTPANAQTAPLAVAPFNADEAKETQRLWAQRIGRQVIHSNSIGMKLVLLPPGEFMMGRTEKQFDELLEAVDRDPQLRKNRAGIITWSMLMMPAHRVRLTKPFYMGATGPSPVVDVAQTDGLA